MKKILIITYYWPPSGGAGVQRWVKLSKYMNNINIDPYVITVHENYASYLKTDYSLNEDVSDDVKVYKTKSFEPINYYSKLVGKKNVPTAGYSNIDNNKVSRKIISFIRSNIFIPDPRIGWNRYAFRKAVELINQENIRTVIISSPPHSNQLIGCKLKRKLDIKWIADLRDPWTDIYYYDLLQHSFLSDLKNKYLEKKVLINADMIFTVSQQLKDLFEKKDSSIDSSKIHIIPNGYDKDDFINTKKVRNQEFTICYTGTMSDIYEPSILFRALKSVVSSNPDIRMKLQIIGFVADSIKNTIKNAEIDADFIPTVPHDEVVKYQLNADLLLLIIPDVENAGGILTGKLFEYLATGNTILCIGPESGDAARIITDCKAGKTYNRNNETSIIQYIENQIDRFNDSLEHEVDWREIERFSRQNQAAMIKTILDRIN